MKLFAFWLLFISFPAFAGVGQLSEREFLDLAADLAPKVNLFRDVWEKDPKAEIYGGTSRDYLLWLKGQFREANSPAEAQKIAKELRARPVIDVREFLIKASDVDIISENKLNIDASRYDVKNVDSQKPQIFDPTSERGIDERRQGHLPAEKIRLGQKGIIENPGMGNGAQEIYSGRLTAQFSAPEEFAKTAYAKQKLNHPVLLALRYLRLQAMNYFQEHGPEAPRDARAVLRGLDSASAKRAREAIQAATDGGALAEYLEKPRFASWVNGSIQKSFRSYSNPTAAHILLKDFGVDALATRYSGQIEPINQFLFSKERDMAQIEKQRQKAGLKATELYRAPEDFFTDGFLYHGTKTEDSFRGILLQGALPSTRGNAGGGLYGVDKANIKIAKEFQGEKDLLVKFPVKPGAKIIDLRVEPGKSLSAKWGQDLDGFADAFGADLLIYPYRNSYAFVVKNSAALGNPLGVHKQVVSLKVFAEKLRAEPESSLYNKLKAGLVADEEMLVGEELAGRLGREEKSAQVLKDFRDDSWPASYRRSLAKVIVEKNLPLTDAREFLRILGEAKISAGEKVAAIDRSVLGEEKIIEAIRSIPADQAIFASNIELLLSSRLAKAPEVLADWIRLADGQEFITLAQTLPESVQKNIEAWQPKVREQVMALVEDGERGKSRLKELAATGVWERLPGLHDSILMELQKQNPEAALEFANTYLNSLDHPHAWRNRMPLFRDLLELDRFTTTKLLAGSLFRNDELRKHPDMFLELAGRLDTRTFGYHVHTGSDWLKIPLVAKMVGNAEYASPDRVRSNWLDYRRKDYLKNAGKLRKDPLTLIAEMNDLLFSEEDLEKILIKSKIPDSEWLDILEREGAWEDKSLIARYFLRHKPSARAKDWLVRKYQETAPEDRRKVARLAEELLRHNKPWQEAFPVTTVDFLLEFKGVDGEYLFNDLVVSGFFQKYPEQFTRVLRSQDKQLLKKVISSMQWNAAHLNITPGNIHDLTQGIASFDEPEKEREFKRLKAVVEDPLYAERQDLREALAGGKKRSPPQDCAGAFAQVN